jgi:hypothetical protein
MTGGPVEVIYFYRTTWGHHDEFMELFNRNHLPVLQELVKTGLLLDVRVRVPRFHGEGRADWDVMVAIDYRDWAVLEGHPEPAVIDRLFQDKARYAEEERRRFSLLDAHWDVVLEAPPG